MANINRGGGFRLVGTLHGGPPRIRKYYIQGDYATALYKGDAVISGGSSDATGKYPDINVATEGGAIRGVIVSFCPDPDNLTRKYSPASTEGYAFVCDDPDALFECQQDDTFAVTDMGSNCDMENATSGSTSTGRSGQQLDQGTLSSGAAQWRVIRVTQKVDNALGDYCQILCMPNEHELKSTTGV